ncbi:hypothetical protein LTR84_010975 [Exophiala bonariae]|uniref:Uncharacterized protein n=1 Tax=Exophiala bonariae TaxID=1690606 RepID=A0AAV9NKB5_9EURO|nr:hypothetical protein LTR84_010975 [Exophiala bonariae]
MNHSAAERPARAATDKYVKRYSFETSFSANMGHEMLTNLSSTTISVTQTNNGLDINVKHEEKFTLGSESLTRIAGNLETLNLPGNPAQQTMVASQNYHPLAPADDPTETILRSFLDLRNIQNGRSTNDGVNPGSRSTGGGSCRQGQNQGYFDATTNGTGHQQADWQLGSQSYGYVGGRSNEETYGQTYERGCVQDYRRVGGQTYGYGSGDMQTYNCGAEHRSASSGGQNHGYVSGRVYEYDEEEEECDDNDTEGDAYEYDQQEEDYHDYNDGEQDEYGYDQGEEEYYY